MNVTAHKSYDVLVVGAGMVGATLACALQQCNPDGKYRFLLLESAAIDVSKKPAQPAYDARSTALSAGSAGYLENLGLWTELQDYATAIRNIHVSDRGHFGAVRLHCDDYQLDALGFVIENIRLGQVLNRGVTAAPDIELRDATRVVDLMPIQDGMSVTVEKNGHKQRLEAQLVVLAEGGRSGLCERLGIHHKQTGYGQTAVIANVSFTDKHANVAFERFTDNGPLALLPLGSHEGDCRAALVWTHKAQQAREILKLSDREFLAQLQEAFGNRLGRFVKAGQRASYPLNLIRAEEQYRNGLVLVGNVAQTLHPVAGQGFNLALRNTLSLAQIISHALAGGDSPGQVRVLQQYINQVAADQDKTVGFSDYLTRLFSSDSSASVWARKFGLFSIDMIPPLKHALVRQAMGKNTPLAWV